MSIAWENPPFIALALNFSIGAAFGGGQGESGVFSQTLQRGGAAL
ncbi:hypothetical protein HMPREF0262_01291 [Clostridium sp. ATCC 29733]|nr:hypothetical protein HMPREF0262_01291 [Clostridium sp. ATCC 29733]